MLVSLVKLELFGAEVVSESLWNDSRSDFAKSRYYSFVLREKGTVSFLERRVYSVVSGSSFQLGLKRGLWGEKLLV